MKTAISLSAAIVLMIQLAGCEMTTRKSFTLVVENKSAKPMTLWLTKNGSPVEQSWASPEQLAIAGEGKNVTGVIVPPGKTAEIPKIDGKFTDSAVAVLRVYRGQLKLNEILVVGVGSPNRQDITLKPGKTELIIDADGKVQSK